VQKKKQKTKKTKAAPQLSLNHALWSQMIEKTIFFSEEKTHSQSLKEFT
jgi:hypothetical protein